MRRSVHGERNVLRGRRCRAGTGGRRRFQKLTAVSALLGFCQNLLSTEGTTLCCLWHNGCFSVNAICRLGGPHGFQFGLSVDKALLRNCRSAVAARCESVSTVRANLSVFANATRAPWAFRASGEGQCKTDGAEQDSKAKPQATVCASVAGDDSRTDAEQQPADYDEFHNVVFITFRGPIVGMHSAARGGSFFGNFRQGYPDGTTALVTGSKIHLTSFHFTGVING